MKKLLKKICFVLFILSFFVFFFSIGKSGVRAQVENCTLGTLGDVCDLGNGEEGVCEGVKNIYGGYSSFYCQGPEEEGLVEQCTEETLNEPCNLGGGEEGVCEGVKNIYGGYSSFYCQGPEEEETSDEEEEDKIETPPPPTLGGDGNGPSIAGIVDTLLDYLFPIAGVIALIFIIMGGYMWIISAGDPSKVKQAQGTLTWAIIGLVVVMVIFSVLRILINFLS
jgi:hypothetical protein